MKIEVEDLAETEVRSSMNGKDGWKRQFKILIVKKPGVDLHSILRFERKWD